MTPGVPCWDRYCRAIRSIRLTIGLPPIECDACEAQAADYCDYCDAALCDECMERHNTDHHPDDI